MSFCCKSLFCSLLLIQPCFPCQPLLVRAWQAGAYTARGLSHWRVSAAIRFIMSGLSLLGYFPVRFVMLVNVVMLNSFQHLAPSLSQILKQVQDDTRISKPSEQTPSSIYSGCWQYLYQPVCRPLSAQIHQSNPGQQVFLIQSAF